MISIEYDKKVAIITLKNEKKLNSMSRDAFDQLGSALRQVDSRPDTYVTVLIGTGRYFSAYAVGPGNSPVVYVYTVCDRPTNLQTVAVTSKCSARNHGA